jgi:hypothetical protein
MNEIEANLLIKYMNLCESGTIRPFPIENQIISEFKEMEKFSDVPFNIPLHLIPFMKEIIAGRDDDYAPITSLIRFAFDEGISGLLPLCCLTYAFVYHNMSEEDQENCFTTVETITEDMQDKMFDIYDSLFNNESEDSSMSSGKITTEKWNSFFEVFGIDTPSSTI